jgi:hypothetical protein
MAKRKPILRIRRKIQPTENVIKKRKLRIFPRKDKPIAESNIFV